MNAAIKTTTSKIVTTATGWKMAWDVPVTATGRVINMTTADDGSVYVAIETNVHGVADRWHKVGTAATIIDA